MERLANRVFRTLFQTKQPVANREKYAVLFLSVIAIVTVFTFLIVINQ
jgi:hypothetical protein